MANRVENSEPGLSARGSVFEVLTAAAKLGMTSFGGPIAHLGYFHDEYVMRRKWLDQQSFSDLAALCQFLPGPASSQLGIAIGVGRAGLLGGLAAWIGFTLPSAVALVLFGYVVAGRHIGNAGWLHGLMIVAVAVVAQAVWGMAQKLANTAETGSIAILAAIASLLFGAAYIQVLVIVLAGVVGWAWFRNTPRKAPVPIHVPIRRRTGLVALILFFALLIGLPLASSLSGARWLQVASGFYGAGALVFGGGHVVLPLLQHVVVPPGWTTNDQFLAGYGAAQAVPGPLFTFSAYLGTVFHSAPNGVVGAVLALVAIFLPAFLLIVGALPFWNAIRARSGLQSALVGINAAVVGMLVAALYDPVWTSAITGPADVGLALADFGLLVLWKIPPWLVVMVSGAGGVAMAYLR